MALLPPLRVVPLSCCVLLCPPVRARASPWQRACRQPRCAQTAVHRAAAAATRTPRRAAGVRAHWRGARRRVWRLFRRGAGRAHRGLQGQGGEGNGAGWIARARWAASRVPQPQAESVCHAPAFMSPAQASRLQVLITCSATMRGAKPVNLKASTALRSCWLCSTRWQLRPSNGCTADQSPARCQATALSLLLQL